MLYINMKTGELRKETEGVNQIFLININESWICMNKVLKITVPTDVPMTKDANWKSRSIFK